MELIKQVIAEFLGTFILVLVGCAVAASRLSTALFIAVAFGIIAIALIYIFNKYSAYFNPALACADYLDGKLDTLSVLCLVAAQFLGAICAAGLVFWFYGNSGAALGENSTTEIFKVLMTETLFTAVLVLVFLFATRQLEPTYAAIMIGLTLLVCVLAAFPMSGGSLNPARAFGPALFNKQAAPIYWVYLLGPLLGALIAYLIFKCFQYQWSEESTVKCFVPVSQPCVQKERVFIEEPEEVVEEIFPLLDTTQQPSPVFYQLPVQITSSLEKVDELKV
jgi:glycerol uptake facilitator-like aquaporin